jgi:hypothetical protein
MRLGVISSIPAGRRDPSRWDGASRPRIRATGNNTSHTYAAGKSAPAKPQLCALGTSASAALAPFGDAPPAAGGTVRRRAALDPRRVIEGVPVPIAPEAARLETVRDDAQQRGARHEHVEGPSPRALTHRPPNATVCVASPSITAPINTPTKHTAVMFVLAQRREVDREVAGGVSP